MSAFEKLLGELTAAQTEQNGLAKSLTATGEGEGGEGGAGSGEGDGAAAAAAAAGGEGGAAAGADGAATMVKSMKVTLADGSEADAVDGTEMLKALEARIDGGEKKTIEVVGQLVSLVKSQNALIKSLGDQVTSLRGEGRGRKALLSVTERPGAGETPLAKGGAAGAGGEGLSVETFLMKSEAAWKAGAITGKEFTTVDVACRTGVAVDAPLIQKILGVK